MMLDHIEAAIKGIEAMFLPQSGRLCDRNTKLIGLMRLGGITGAREARRALDREGGRGEMD